MKLLAKFIHGSHLYGLNTPDSDMDYKGVYMPSIEDYLSCSVKPSINLSTNQSNVKNSSSDVDYEVYSINKFVQMLASGEMVAFDMLFAPESMVEYYDDSGNVIPSDSPELRHNPVWVLRKLNTHLFVSRDMKAYLGYCKKQAAKYGIKGSRLSDLREVVETVDELFERGVLSSDRLEQYVEHLPTTEHCYREGQMYVVLGKKHQLTTNIYEFHDRVHIAFKQYGDRAHKAEQNDGVDWKAVSHAFRAGYQLLQMYKTNRMVLPLPQEQREKVLAIKLGERDWNDVKAELEELINQVELSASCFGHSGGSEDTINFVLLNLIRRYHNVR